MDLIDKKTIVSICNEIKGERNREINFGKEKVPSLLNKFPFLRNKILRPIYLSKILLFDQNKHIFSNDTEAWNFLKYGLQEHYTFDLDWFPKEDRQEIKSLLKIDWNLPFQIMYPNLLFLQEKTLFFKIDIKNIFHKLRRKKDYLS